MYIIWISDEIDGVLLNTESKIVSFNTEHSLRQHLTNMGLEFTGDTTVLDIGYIQQWLVNPVANVNYNTFLNSWNLFTDISSSLGIQFLGDKKEVVRNSVYDKLFDSAGPFIEENPDMIFNNRQIAVLAEVMKNGISLLFDHLALAAN